MNRYLSSEIWLLRAAAVRKGDELMVAYIDIAYEVVIGALNSDSVELIDGIPCFRVNSDAKTAASANRLIPMHFKV